MAFFSIHLNPFSGSLTFLFWFFFFLFLFLFHVKPKYFPVWVGLFSALQTSQNTCFRFILFQVILFDTSRSNFKYTELDRLIIKWLWFCFCFVFSQRLKQDFGCRFDLIALTTPDVKGFLIYMTVKLRHNKINYNGRNSKNNDSSIVFSHLMV